MEFRMCAAMVSICLIQGCCAIDHEATTAAGAFVSAYGFSIDGPWVTLKRPNSVWKLGTVLEVEGKKLEDIGDIENLNCFPDSAWRATLGKAPSTQFEKQIGYGLSLAATLGVAKEELVKAGIVVAGDAERDEIPRQKAILKVEDSSESRLDYLVLEAFIGENFDGMSVGCKRVLTTPNRYIIDGIFQVNKGELNLEGNNGVRVDFSTPKLKKIADAAFVAGFKVSSSGKILIGEDGTPMVVAVRARRFDDILNQIGKGGKGGAPVDFEMAMDEAKAAIHVRWK